MINYNVINKLLFTNCLKYANIVLYKNVFIYMKVCGKRFVQNYSVYNTNIYNKVFIMGLIWVIKNLNGLSFIYPYNGMFRFTRAKC